MLLDSLISSNNDFLELLVAFFLLYLPFWLAAYGGGTKQPLFTLEKRKWYFWLLMALVVGCAGSFLAYPLSTSALNSAAVYVLLFFIGHLVGYSNRKRAEKDSKY